QHLVFDVVTIANFHGPDLAEVDNLYRLGRERQMPARTRLCRLEILAETQHHATLTGIYNIKAAGQPNQHGNNRYQANTGAKSLLGPVTTRFVTTALATLAAHHGGNFLIELAQ